MRTRPAVFDRVRELGLALPGVEVGTAYGSPALKVRGRMFACIAIHKSAEPNSLAIRMHYDKRDALIEENPQAYYLTEHYVDYPVVLVRLDRVDRDALHDLLQVGWRFMSGGRAARIRGPRRQR